MGNRPTGTLPSSHRSRLTQPRTYFYHERRIHHYTDNPLSHFPFLLCPLLLFFSWKRNPGQHPED